MSSCYLLDSPQDSLESIYDKYKDIALLSKFAGGIAVASVRGWHISVDALIGILPEGSTVPRLYSLASGRSDGFIEIIVKKQPGGLCSGQLTALEPGATVPAFLRRNPGFRPDRGRAPLILIGAGTGIGPLAGFVRGNARRRPVHLFFGMRHPGSDFLYGEEISAWREEGRLTRLITAVSRGTRPRYVQDALRGDAAQVAQLVLVEAAFIIPADVGVDTSHGQVHLG